MLVQEPGFTIQYISNPLQECRFITQHKGFTETVAPTPYSQQSNNTKETKNNNNAEAGNNKESTTHTPHPDNKKKETCLHTLQPLYHYSITL